MNGPDAKKRFRCRIGLHRWIRLRHEDADLESPQASAQWRTSCRYCGAPQSSGVVVLAVVSVGVLGGGIAVALTLHSLLGPILIIGGVMGVGWVAFTEGLARIVTFLSTGTWRRR